VSEIRRPESLRRNEESASTNLPKILSWAEGAPLVSPFWRDRFWWALSGAAAWVAIEMCIARFLSGFPWDLLGVSQYGLVPLIQIASITGVYGVSFIVVWASLSLLLASVAVLRRPTLRYAWMGEIIVPLGALVGLFLFGFSQTRSIEEPSRKLKVTFVQPSIPQELIWDETKNEDRFRDLIQLSAEALTNKTDLLLWPEAAVPGLLRYNENIFAALTGLARSNLIQQGGELTYLIRHDPDFRGVRREHLVELGLRVHARCALRAGGQCDHQREQSGKQRSENERHGRLLLPYNAWTALRAMPPGH